RADMGIGVCAVADLHGAQGSRRVLNKFVLNLLMHQPARSCAANLAGVKRHRSREGIRYCSYVYIIKNHSSALAAQLEFHRHKISPARFSDQTANFRRTGEGHALKSWMTSESGPCGFTEACYHIDDPGRHAGFL